MRDYFTDPAVRTIADGHAEPISRPQPASRPKQCLVCGQTPCVEVPHEDAS